MHLRDTRIPMKLKEKVYQMAILQAILYGCQNIGQVKKNKMSRKRVLFKYKSEMNEQ